MPYEDIVANMGIGVRVAILLGLIGIFMLPWVFDVGGPELGPTLIPTFLSPDDTPGSSSVIVAAHDSSAALKSGADYVCDGIQDQNEINAAFNALSQGGEVILTSGTFYCDAAILPGEYTIISGKGVMKTFLVDNE